MLVKHFEGEKLRNVRSNPVSLLVPGNEQFFLSRWVQDVCSPCPHGACPPRSVSPTPEQALQLSYPRGGPAGLPGLTADIGFRRLLNSGLRYVETGLLISREFH